jgi:hypothetical protein
MDGVMISDTQSGNVYAASPRGAGTVEPLDPDETIRVGALDADVSLVDSGESEPGSQLGTILRRLTPLAPPMDEAQPEGDRPAMRAAWRSSAKAAVRDALLAIPSTLVRLVGKSKALAAYSWRGLLRIEAGLRIRLNVAHLHRRLAEIVHLLGFEHAGRKRRASKVFRARMSETEIAMLSAIAQAWGCSPSQVVRVLVLQQCRSLSSGPHASVGLDPTSSLSKQWVGVRRTLVLPTGD